MHVLLHQKGYAPVPVLTGQKRPALNNWVEYAKSREVPGSLPLDALNVGIATHNVRALDVDLDVEVLESGLGVKEAKALVERIYETLIGFCSEHGMQPPVRRREKAEWRALFLFNVDWPRYKTRLLVPKPEGFEGKWTQGIELLGHGQQFVGYGQHPDGDMYEWYTNDPLACARSDLPTLTKELEDELLRRLAEVGLVRSNKSSGNADDGVPQEQPDQVVALFGVSSPEVVARWSRKEGWWDALSPEGKYERLAEMLEHVQCTGERDDWRDWLFSIHDAVKGSEEGKQIALDWSRTQPGWDDAAPDELDKIWASAGNYDGPKRTVGSLIAAARDNGWNVAEVRRSTEVARARAAAPAVADPNEPGNAVIPAIITPKYPREVTKTYLDLHHGDEKARTLARHQEVIYRWRNGVWKDWDKDKLAQHIYSWLMVCSCIVRDKNGNEARAPVDATMGLVKEVLGQVLLSIELPETDNAPFWRGDRTGRPDPRNQMILRNGIFDPVTKELHPHDPKLFAHNRVEASWDPKAQCPQWVEFLSSIFHEDDAYNQIRLLQEYFGYLLVEDASFQKGLWLQGPTRSGKGTIGQVMRALIGDGAVGMTLQDLSETFGLAKLCDKRLAVLGDVRVGRKVDFARVAERLLSMIGGDTMSIDRKYKQHWSGVVTTKFVAMSNEANKLHDNGGALAGRFLYVVTNNSFADNPDLLLLPRLLSEIDGILVWALDGLARLRAQGHFTKTDTHERAAQKTRQRMASIQSAFDELVLYDPAGSVRARDLMEAIAKWHAANDMDAPSEQAVGRVLSDLADQRRKFAKKRDKHGNLYTGIALNEEAVEALHVATFAEDMAGFDVLR